MSEIARPGSAPPAAAAPGAPRERAGAAPLETRRGRGPGPDPASSPARGYCMNCDTALSGPFCSNCGQRATRYSVSLAVLAKDFADEYLSFDSRLFRTVLNLFFRPGFLTRQYLIGRRVRYVRPLRLYIVASLLFFLAFSIKGSGIRLDIGDGAGAPAGVVTLQPERPGDDAATAAEPTVRDDSWTESVQGRFRVLGMEIDAQERARRVATLGPQGMIDAFFAGIERYLPRLMFLLLPLFALLLKVLYVRRRWYYAEHFVFAVHIHAFFFALFLLVLILPEAVRPGKLLTLWGSLYLYLAMHQVYRQGWIKTAFKYMLLTGAYSFAVTLTFVGLVVATLLLI